MDDEPEEGLSPAEEAITEPLISLANDRNAGAEERTRASVLIEEQITLARLQRAHLKTQHIRDRFLVAFDLALAIGGAVVVAAILALLWDAWSAHSVVIDQFDVPASFAARGYSGKVIASEIKENLREFQHATRSSQAKRSVSDAWSNRIQLQIPEAGISVDEVQNLLHRWLGRDEHIAGGLAEEGTQIRFTIYGDNITAKDFTGPASDLHALLVKAAEYIYGKSEPYLFSVYLSNQGRDAEAIALIKGAFPTADSSDKPLLLSIWSNALSDSGRYKEALEKAEESVRLNPRFWLGWNGVMAQELSLGNEEAVAQTGQQMQQISGRGYAFAAHVPAVYWGNYDYVVSDWQAFHSEVTADMAENEGQGTATADEAPIDAWSLAQMHDWRAAELELDTSRGDKRDNFLAAESAFVRAAIAADRKEWPAAAADMKIVGAIVAKDAATASNIPTPVLCWLGLSSAMAGDVAAGETALARGGRYVDCYRFKGDIEDKLNHWPAAAKDYKAAVTLAPSIPSSYLSWGDALLRHKRYDEASKKFSRAHLKGPHWADPLERLGEVYAAQGHWADAAAQYQKAAEYAPKWGLLYLNWGRALDKLDRHAEALTAYQRAWTANLTGRQRSSIYGCCR
jgi:tetratricopeptide (TPR) repeat protein